MRLTDISFPNYTLPSGWYGTAYYPIGSLIFHRCDLRAFEPGVFDAPAFSSLHFFSFIELKHTDLSFANIVPVYTTFLYIQTTHFHRINISMNLFEPYAKSLHTLELDYFPDTQPEIHIFKSAKYLQLSVVYIRCEGGGVIRSIDGSHFKNLRQIQTLYLTQCGIAHIESGTFDFIGRTLTEIDLTSNKLKSIEVIWFYTFFTVIDTSMKYVNLHQNPIECNCDVFELEVTKTFIKYFNKYRAISPKLLPLRQCEEAFVNLNCGTQIISRDKIQVDQSPDADDTFVFSKLNLRIASNSLLVVKTNVRLPIRIWLQRHNWIEVIRSSKCPSRHWLRESVTCLFLTEKTRMIPIIRLLQGTLITTFYAILTVPKKHVWPLHMQTYRHQQESDENFPSFILALMPFSFLPSFLLGIVWTVWCNTDRRLRSLPRNTCGGRRFVYNEFIHKFS